MSYAKNIISITQEQKSLLREIMTIGCNSNLVNPQKNIQLTKNISQKPKKSKSNEKNFMAEQKKVESSPNQNPNPNPNQNEITNKKVEAQIEEKNNKKNTKPLPLNLSNASVSPREIDSSPKIYNYNTKDYPLSPTHIARIMKPPIDELAFLHEKNEWVAMNKFQMYKDSQENKTKKNKIYKEMKNLNSFIHSQLQQKKNGKIIKTQEDNQYLNYLKEKLQKEIEKEKEIEEIRKQRKKIEQILREKEIKQNQLKKKIQAKEKFALDEKALNANPPVNQKEAEKKKIKKIKEQKIAENYLEENLKKHKERIEKRQFEKEENIQYQKNFQKDMEKREEQRLALIKEKQMEVDHKLEDALRYDKKELETKKYQNIINGFSKSHERNNIILIEKEEFEKNKKNSQLKDLKNILEDQIQEKKTKDLMKKDTANEQGRIWREETKINEDLDNRKREEKMKIKKQWALELQNQINEKEELKNQYRNKMSGNESLLNKPLLDEIQRLRVLS